MKYLFRSSVTLLCGLLLIVRFPAQQTDFDKTIVDKTGELDKIRREIRQYQTELKATQDKERNLLTKLQETEKNISLSEKMLNQLNRELNLKEQEIRRNNTVINRLNSEMATLKSNFARRLVRIYKQGDYSDLELILSAQSINQAIYRYKYLRTLTEIDYKTVAAIRHNIRDIEAHKQIVITEKLAQEQLARERRSYQNELSNQKKQRETQLAAAKKDQRSLANQIREKEQAAQKLAALITDLEKKQEERRRELERQRALVGLQADNPFLQNQGKLRWPANGKVVSKFGTQKHPTLNTITENSGIDIRVKKGEPVYAILDGVITTITYIRGFGNTIIIDHGDGFYSVYTHVENVRVFEKQYVSASTIIANVGDSGSLEGALLHFEIWKNRIKLNPEDWLVRKS